MVGEEEREREKNNNVEPKRTSRRRAEEGQHSLNTSEACGQFHDSGERVTSGYGRGQIRHQEAF